MHLGYGVGSLSRIQRKEAINMWFNTLRRSGHRLSRRHPPAWWRRARPIVEVLEDRTVLSIAYGLSTTNTLIQFDTNTPTAASTPVSITGLQTGEVIVGIDFRPATGQLIAVGVTDPTGA